MSNSSNSQTNPRAALWVTRSQAITDETLQQRLLPQLSDSERERLNTIGSVRRQHEYLTSRALMRYALGVTLDRPFSAFHFHENGAFPTIAPYPDELDLSLSHSHGLIGFALATLPVGLDIEWLKRDSRSELQHYLNDDEDRALLERYRNLDPDERFLYSWSLREAWYKARPSHQTTAATALSLTRIEASGWTGHAIRIADHLCVISTPEPIDIDLYYCTPFAGQRRIYPKIRRIEAR